MPVAAPSASHRRSPGPVREDRASANHPVRTSNPRATARTFFSGGPLVSRRGKPGPMPLRGPTPNPNATNQVHDLDPIPSRQALDLLIRAALTESDGRLLLPAGPSSHYSRDETAWTMPVAVIGLRPLARSNWSAYTGPWPGLLRVF